MGCGCSTYIPTCGCQTVSNCPTVCGSLVVSNSFNIPACDATATITVPKLKNLLLNSYLWNGSYGYYKVTSFNALTGEVIITNTCVAGNSTPGTIVPASTNFLVSPAPISSNVVAVTSISQTVPACSTNMTLTTPGLLSAIVGSYIWNPTYGIYKVISYNATTNALVVQNDCSYNTVAPATVIPADTSFLFTTTPQSIEAVDFSASAVWTGSGALTYTPSETHYKYIVRDNVVEGWVTATGTTAGVTSDLIFLNLPFAPDPDLLIGGVGAPITVNISEGGTGTIGYGYIRTTDLAIAKIASANFTLGAGEKFGIHFSYIKA